MPSVIALDAMGSDRAPKPEIEGAIQAARQYGVRVLLIGPEATVKAELDRHRAALASAHRDRPRQRIHHHGRQSGGGPRQARLLDARGLAHGARRPGRRLRHRRQHRRRHGHRQRWCWAQLPASIVPRWPRFFRPPPEPAAMLLDVGANVDCKPHNLEQFAVMGDIYFRAMFRTCKVWHPGPRVGLLSIGEEEAKGNELTREAFQLLKQLPLNFVGNVEGRDLYNGKVDVIVCDGFVGNVALKISEGVANLVRTALKESLKATITSQVGALLSRSAFTDFKKRLDYTEYGGAPLLGVKGVCIITHGSSNANAIKNAVRVAAEFSESSVNESIETRPARRIASGTQAKSVTQSN